MNINYISYIAKIIRSTEAAIAEDPFNHFTDNFICVFFCWHKLKLLLQSIDIYRTLLIDGSILINSGIDFLRIDIEVLIYHCILQN